MGGDKPVKYPWGLQFACVLLGIATIIGAYYFAPVPLDANSPLILWIRGLVFIGLHIAGIVMLFLAPSLVHARWRKRWHTSGDVCGRCEKDLPSDGYAQYGDEMLCEDCAAIMEKLEGQKLPRVTKR